MYFFIQFQVKFEEMDEFYPFENLKLTKPVIKNATRKYKTCQKKIKLAGYRGLGERIHTKIQLNMETKNLEKLNSSLIHARLKALIALFITHFKQKVGIQPQDEIQVSTSIVMQGGRTPDDSGKLIQHDTHLIPFQLFNILEYSRKIATSWLQDFTPGIPIEIRICVNAYQTVYAKLSAHEISWLIPNSCCIVQIGYDLNMGKAIIVGLANIKKLQLLLQKISPEQISEILKKFNRPFSETNLADNVEAIKRNRFNIQTDLANHLYKICHINPSSVCETKCETEDAKKFEKAIGKIHLHILNGNESFKLMYPSSWSEEKTNSIYLLRTLNSRKEYHYDVITNQIHLFQ